MQGATPSRDQPARNTQSSELSVQKKDLELTAAPGTGSVDVDD
jgi:hypothetical protein